MGDVAWQLYCLEHGIGKDGMVKKQVEKNSSISSFFHEVILFYKFL